MTQIKEKYSRERLLWDLRNDPIVGPRPVNIKRYIKPKVQELPIKFKARAENFNKTIKEIQNYQRIIKFSNNTEEIKANKDMIKQSWRKRRLEIQKKKKERKEEEMKCRSRDKDNQLADNEYVKDENLQMMFKKMFESVKDYMK